MERKSLIIIILSVVAITIVSGVIFIKVSHADDTTIDPNTIQVSTTTSGSILIGNAGDDFTYIPPTLENGSFTGPGNIDLAALDGEPEVPFVPATEMDLDPTSITVFVNKEYSLPKDYKPQNLVTPNVIFNLDYYDERTLMRPEAALALEKLFSAAKEDGVILYFISGYRSYDRQKKIFINNIVKQGKKHTLRYSAVPGTSEHQTGLSIDVSSESLEFKLSTGFSTSTEGIWLAENAYHYGYIIRYPEDKGDITGYAYEPWHIRYVGKGLAKYLYTNQLTLDEYYHYEPSPDFDFEALYADLINYVPPVVTQIPVEGDGIIIGENGEIIEGELEEGDTPIEEEEGDPKDSEDGKEQVTDDPDGLSDVPSKEEEPNPTPEDEQEEPTGEDDETSTDPEDGDTTNPTTQDPSADDTVNQDGTENGDPTKNSDTTPAADQVTPAAKNKNSTGTANSGEVVSSNVNTN